MSQTQDGWYPDPNDPSIYRHWDGTRWTGETMSRGDPTDESAAPRHRAANRNREAAVKWPLLTVAAITAMALLLGAVALAKSRSTDGRPSALNSASGTGMQAAGSQEDCETRAMAAWPTDQIAQLREEAQAIVENGGFNPDFDAWRAKEQAIVDLVGRGDTDVIPQFAACGDDEITAIIRRYNNSQRTYAECNIRGANIQQQYGINSPEDQADMAKGCPNEDLATINADLRNWLVKHGRPIPNG